jgi:hypothetical protein
MMFVVPEGCSGEIQQGRRLDVPDVPVAIPVFEGFAVEDLRPAVMIVEVDRLGLHKAVERRAMGFRCRLLRDGRRGEKAE